MSEGARAYGSGFDHVRDLLEKVRLLLLSRLRAQSFLSGEEEEGGFPVVQFLTENAEAHRIPRDPELASLLEEVDATVGRRCAASDPGVLLWNQVVARFGLSATDELLLLACIAPSFSTGFELAFRSTGAELAGGRVRLNFLADLLAGGDEERWALLRALHPSSRLVASGLLTFADSDAGTPLVAGMLGPSPILFDFLLGQPLGAGRPVVLPSICEVVPVRAGDPEPPSPLSEEFERRVLAGEVFVVRGGGPNTAQSVEEIAGTGGYGLLRVDWVPDEQTPWTQEIHRQVALLARLYGLIPVLDLRGRPEAPASTRLLLFLGAMAGMARVVAVPSSNWKGKSLWSMKLPVLGREDA